MDTLFIVRDSLITCASRSTSCCQSYEESVISILAWPVVVAFGLFLAFVFASLWLYISKGNKKQENNSANNVTDSKEKQLGELQNLLYKHLQTRVYIEKVDKEGHKYKEYNGDNDNKYIEILTNAINELKEQKK